MSTSNFVPTINEGRDTYKGVWAERDEAENFSQKHDQELIKEEKRMEVCGLFSEALHKLGLQSQPLTTCIYV